MSEKLITSKEFINKYVSCWDMVLYNFETGGFLRRFYPELYKYDKYKAKKDGLVAYPLEILLKVFNDFKKAEQRNSEIPLDLPITYFNKTYYDLLRKYENKNLKVHEHIYLDINIRKILKNYICLKEPKIKIRYTSFDNIVFGEENESIFYTSDSVSSTECCFCGLNKNEISNIIWKKDGYISLGAIKQKIKDDTKRIKQLAHILKMQCKYGENVYFRPCIRETNNLFFEVYFLPEYADFICSLLNIETPKPEINYCKNKSCNICNEGNEHTTCKNDLSCQTESLTVKVRKEIVSIFESNPESEVNVLTVLKNCGIPKEEQNSHNFKNIKCRILRELFLSKKIKLTGFEVNKGAIVPCYQSILGNKSQISIIDGYSEEPKKLGLCTLAHFFENTKGLSSMKSTRFYKVLEENNIPIYAVSKQGFSFQYKKEDLEKFFLNKESKITEDEKPEITEEKPITIQEHETKKWTFNIFGFKVSLERRKTISNSGVDFIKF